MNAAREWSTFVLCAAARWSVSRVFIAKLSSRRLPRNLGITSIRFTALKYWSYLTTAAPEQVVLSSLGGAAWHHQIRRHLPQNSAMMGRISHRSTWSTWIERIKFIEKSLCEGDGGSNEDHECFACCRTSDAIRNMTPGLEYSGASLVIRKLAAGDEQIRHLLDLIRTRAPFSSQTSTCSNLGGVRHDPSDSEECF